MLSLDPQAFDQGKDGWRSLEAKPGCESAAADVIAEYRARGGDRATPSQVRVMLFHEGQMRAIAGEAQRAVPLIEQAAVDSPSEDWRAYSAATVAFLRRDREALMAARDRLASIPRPGWFEAAARDARARGEQISWPPNLDVVDGLLQCFNRNYREAFDPACRPSNRDELGTQTKVGS